MDQIGSAATISGQPRHPTGWWAALAIVVGGLAVIFFGAIHRFAVTRMSQYEIVRTDRLTGHMVSCFIVPSARTRCMPVVTSGATEPGRTSSSLPAPYRSGALATSATQMETMSTNTADDPVAELRARADSIDLAHARPGDALDSLYERYALHLDRTDTTGAGDHLVMDTTHDDATAGKVVRRPRKP
jgi:hypothetical protein